MKSLTAFFRAAFLALPFVLAAGCARHRSTPNSTAAFSPLPAESFMAPTSGTAESRSYSEGSGTNQATFPRPRGSATEADWTLASNIRDALATDQTMTTYPANVSATVDNNSPGRVKLTGTVITTKERRRIHDKIAQIPGVTQIDDQLVVTSIRPQGRGILK